MCSNAQNRRSLDCDRVTDQLVSLSTHSLRLLVGLLRRQLRKDERQHVRKPPPEGGRDVQAFKIERRQALIAQLEEALVNGEADES